MANYETAPKDRRRYLFQALSGLTPSSILSLTSQADNGDLGYLNSAAQELLTKEDLKGLTDSRVSALNRKTLTLQKPVDESPLKEEIYSFCDLIIKNLKGIESNGTEYSISELIAKMSLSWFFGLSINFIEWSNLSGTDFIVPSYIEHIDERRYKIDIHSQSIKIDTEDYSNGECLKDLDESGIHYVVLKDSAITRLELSGIARSILPVYYLRNRSALNLMAYAEKFSIPSIIIQKANTESLVTDDSSNEREELENFLQSYMNDCAAILPPGFTSDIFGAISGGEKIFEVIDRITKSQLATAILGQDGTSSGSGGSFAKAQINEITRQDLIDSDCKRVAAAFKQILEKAVRINYGAECLHLVPDVYFANSVEVQRELAIEDIKTAKALGLQISKSYVYDVLKIQKPLHELDIL